ncbi:Septum site-determining protein MinD [Sulfitobacter sp. THAF37]|uniref:AAA family ATPase n=1 Tax=Sulfitobacter sp. THAF37 TaxID=2587855 RepID=UPI001267DDD3|nr:AAA family ATPase [Sulfitobacter sp. THAF37]QFT58101.1 Septum site-determining protein MinD [Sulfitobacter sp. THAF37]
MTIALQDIEKQVAAAIAAQDRRDTAPRTNVIIAVQNPELGRHLSDEMGQDPSVAGTVVHGPLADVLMSDDLELDRIDIIAFEVGTDAEADFAALKRVEDMLTCPQFIAVSTRPLPDDIRNAMLDCGVHDMLVVKPGQSADHAERAPQEPPRDIPSPATGPETTLPEEIRNDGDMVAAGHGDVTVMLRARGGAGASTVAVNLAAAIAQESKPGSTALVDLDIQNGAIALMLDLPDSDQATRFVRGDVIPDAAFLDDAMARHASGLDVLTAPDVFAPLSAISPQDMVTLISALKTRYDNIVIDMPQTIVDWMDPVLANASRVLVVSDMSLPSVRRTRRLIDLIAEEHMTLPIKVVMNFEKKPLVTTEAHKEAAQLIGRPLIHWIPADARATKRAVDLGRPVIISGKRSGPARAMVALKKTLFASAARG